jgi:hypothetical protein
MCYRAVHSQEVLAVIQTAIQLRTVILPGHRIEITAPELPEGQSATVVVLLDEPSPPKRRLTEVLAGYPGGQLFRSAEEVDAYLRAERDSWDR